MGKGVNKVIIVGRLGDDPTVRYMPSGDAVANISVATTESWKDKVTGQQQERTEWHRVCFFGKLAEIVRDYLKKGSQVYVEGSLRTRKWQDKDSGQDRYSTEIIADEMQMLDSKSDNQDKQNDPGVYQGASQPQQSQQQGGQQGQAMQSAHPGMQGGGQDDFDSDIPFR